MYISKVAEKPKYLEKPNDQRNHNHKIEDLFDFMIHGDECIDNP